MKINVRMYRQGLGDCFLLRFGKTNVLIDCGVVTSAPGGKENVRKVVEHIKKTTGGHLHVVVATHEHWDHVSGFDQAKDIFAGMQIDEIWMAWTEDPKDKQANEIRAERALRLKKLGTALEAWQGAIERVPRPDRTLFRARAAAATTASILDFFGPGELASKGDKTRTALAFLKDHDAPKRYLEPSDTVPIGGLQVHVLGPPRKREYLKKDLPSKGDHETYTEMRLSAADAFLAAATRDDTDERCQPFDRFYRLGDDAARNHPFFARRYGFDSGGPHDDPNDGGPAWRRIDDDWLAQTGELALDLDSDTNNTSLVLAFETEDGGDVLLFAADAQVGNWLSWQEVSFGEVTAHDLLRRTVLYKVGHHASHNATLSELGLELMKHRGLTALIPVDEKTAHKIGWKKMPFDPLVERLREKCKNRVVRLDAGVDDHASAAFARKVAEDDLYFELEIG